MEKMCPERWKQAVARHAERAERQKHVAASRGRNAEWLARHAERFSNSALPEDKLCAGECRLDDFDAKSTTSVSSTSTAATKTTTTLFLTEQETKEARKYAKMLCEIAVIEENISRGEKVD